jgi:hypothetical protein
MVPKELIHSGVDGNDSVKDAALLVRVELDKDLCAIHCVPFVVLKCPGKWRLVFLRRSLSNQWVNQIREAVLVLRCKHGKLTLGGALFAPPSRINKTFWRQIGHVPEDE